MPAFPYALAAAAIVHSGAVTVDLDDRQASTGGGNEASRLVAGESQLNREKAMQDLRSFAGCLVSSRKANVRENLVYFLARSEPVRRGDWAADAECIGPGSRRGANDYVHQLRIPDPLFRGALLRSLYLSKRRNGGAMPVAAAQISESWDKSRETDSQAILRRLGDCVVSLDASGSERLITADPGSEMNSALVSLKPALGNCLPEGSRIKLSKEVVESVLSEALYRRAEGVFPAPPSNEQN